MVITGFRVNKAEKVDIKRMFQVSFRPAPVHHEEKETNKDEKVPDEIPFFLFLVFFPVYLFLRG